MIIFTTVGYFIGAYFVDFALKRGNSLDPLSPPAAIENIHDKTRKIPSLPNYPNETWTIEDNGLKLVATHFINPGHNWAILVHGYGRDQRYARDYADVYLQHDYQVLTPDLCASGESEGTYITMGVKESEEVAHWARLIVQKDPAAKIVLHGVSMGAATVLMTAARDDCPNIVAVIEDCSYTSAYEMFSVQLQKIFDLPSFPIMNCIDVVSYLKTGSTISSAAPIDTVSLIKVPTLFIHGDADKLIPLDMMEKLFMASTAERSQLIITNAGHADSMTVNPNLYWTTIFNFLSNDNN